MARTSSMVWVPSEKNVRKAYGAILRGISSAIEHGYNEPTCKIEIGEVKQRVSIQFPKRRLYFIITKEGEVLIGLYSSITLDSITQFNLMQHQGYISGLNGWVKELSYLVTGLIQRACDTGDCFERCIDQLQKAVKTESKNKRTADFDEPCDDDNWAENINDNWWEDPDKYLIDDDYMDQFDLLDDNYIDWDAIENQATEY